MLLQPIDRTKFTRSLDAKAFSLRLLMRRIIIVTQFKRH